MSTLPQVIRSDREVSAGPKLGAVNPAADPGRRSDPSNFSTGTAHSEEATMYRDEFPLLRWLTSWLPRLLVAGSFTLGTCDAGDPTAPAGRWSSRVRAMSTI
jgi:hypothetical protein